MHHVRVYCSEEFPVPLDVTVAASVFAGIANLPYSRGVRGYVVGPREPDGPRGYLSGDCCPNGIWPCLQTGAPSVCGFIYGIEEAGFAVVPPCSNKAQEGQTNLGRKFPKQLTMEIEDQSLGVLGHVGQGGRECQCISLSWFASKAKS